MIGGETLWYWLGLVSVPVTIAWTVPQQTPGWILFSLATSAIWAFFIDFVSVVVDNHLTGFKKGAMLFLVSNNRIQRRVAARQAAIANRKFQEAK